MIQEATTTGADLTPLRTPNVFKTALATAAGDTAVWTPAAGKKFRLMGLSIAVTNNSSQAVGGVLEVVLRDGVTAIGTGHSINVPLAAGTGVGANNLPPVSLGNGFLSAAADNVLNVNLSAALVTGEVRVNAWGTEE